MPVRRGGTLGAAGGKARDEVISPERAKLNSLPKSKSPSDFHPKWLISYFDITL